MPSDRVGAFAICPQAQNTMHVSLPDGPTPAQGTGQAVWPCLSKWVIVMSDVTISGMVKVARWCTVTHPRGVPPPLHHCRMLWCGAKFSGSALAGHGRLERHPIWDSSCIACCPYQCACGLWQCRPVPPDALVGPQMLGLCPGLIQCGRNCSGRTCLVWSPGGALQTEWWWRREMGRAICICSYTQPWTAAWHCREWLEKCIGVSVHRLGGFFTWNCMFFLEMAADAQQGAQVVAMWRWSYAFLRGRPKAVNGPWCLCFIPPEPNSPLFPASCGETWVGSMQSLCRPTTAVVVVVVAAAESVGSQTAPSRCNLAGCC